MELYNTIIEKIDGLLGSTQPKRYEYDPAKCWEDVGGNQLVMMKEAAYELGGDNKPAVNYACVTSTDGFADRDEILVYGRDLREINGSVPFARIAVIKVKELSGENEEDTEPLFRAIQDIDFVKYHVYPKGYMIRSSSDSFREQVRVSKEAVRSGITFEQVGNSYISQFKKNPDILSVKMIFLTADDADYAENQRIPREHVELVGRYHKTQKFDREESHDARRNHSGKHRAPIDHFSRLGSILQRQHRRRHNGGDSENKGIIQRRFAVDTEHHSG